MGLRDSIRSAGKGLSIAAAVRRAAISANPAAGSAAAPLETIAFLESFGPSLMPRTSVMQGLAAGLSVLAARGTMGVVEAATTAIVNDDDPLSHHLAMRAYVGGVGAALATLPEQVDEPLVRSGIRTTGRLLRIGAAGGAVYDLSKALQRKYPTSGARPIFMSAAMLGAVGWFAAQRLASREDEIEHWPIPQANKLLPGVGVGVAVAGIGSAGTAAYKMTDAAWIQFFGDSFVKRLLGRSVNAAMWAGAGTFLYNAGVGYIGRSNEKVEPGYSVPPINEFVSGTPDSLSPFVDLGQQGRRFVTDVLTEDYIAETMGEEAKHPIRVFVGYNSEPLYPTGRAEMALNEMERLGAFDRDYLLLVSPTGTGWVDQTLIESAELFTRGDIASVCIQYGRFPSFLSVQKVATGRAQFRLLLWGVRQRIAGMDPDKRPKVLVFGESLGAWTSSDVVMYNGIDGFDHYGIDKALWVGLPWLAKWSRSGMNRGASDLVPTGSVGVFDNPDQLMEWSDAERKDLRAVVLSHDNDPIAVMGPDLMIQKPEWLKGDRGRGVPTKMQWTPMVTFISVLLDAANAMVTVPGHFGSFGHDYRADMARMVLHGLDLPDATDTQVEAVESALRALELERAERIKAEVEHEAPRAPAQRNGEAIVGGVPLRGKRTRGSRWWQSLMRTSGVPQGDMQ